MMFYSGDEIDTIPDMIFGLGWGKPRGIAYGENIRATDHGEIFMRPLTNALYKTLDFFKI
jgi:hypothetical protein